MNNQYTEAGAIPKSIIQANQTEAVILGGGKRCRIYLANDTGNFIWFDKNRHPHILRDINHIAAGSHRQIQFNDNGKLGASENLMLLMDDILYVVKDLEVGKNVLLFEIPAEGALGTSEVLVLNSSDHKIYRRPINHPVIVYKLDLRHKSGNVGEFTLSLDEGLYRTSIFLESEVSGGAGLAQLRVLWYSGGAGISRYIDNTIDFSLSYDWKEDTIFSRVSHGCPEPPQIKYSVFTSGATPYTLSIIIERASLGLTPD